MQMDNHAVPGPAGLVHRLLQMLGRMFGAPVAAAAPSAIANELTTEEDDEGSYVVAPGGYRIRMQRPSDLSHSVGAMLPSVREGLSLLPPLPRVVIDLLQEIQNPKATAASVAQIAATDPALAALLIRTVNSAAMGISRKISSTSEAVSYLGFSAVKAMVIRLRLDEVLVPRSAQGAIDAEDLWVHSLAVSYAADCLAKQVSGVDAGFATTLGLLHDIGKLAMMARLPTEYESLKKQAADSKGVASDYVGNDSNCLTYEAVAFGLNHAALGAELAARWKLPADLIQAIRFHHRPQDAFHQSDPGAVRKAVHLVHIANQLAKYCYPYADQMELEVISDESLAAVGLNRSIDQLLDDGVRSAISRVIIFSQSDTKRTASSPRRFLRFLDETDIQRLPTGDAAARSKCDSAAVDELFDSATRTIDLTKQSVSSDRTEFDGSSVRFIIPATASGIERALPIVLAQQASLSLRNDRGGAASVLISSLLPNLLKICKPDDVIEIVQRLNGGELKIGVRSSAMTGTRRFDREMPPRTMTQIVEAQFAPILNLRWFDEIALNETGFGLVFVSRS